MKTMFSDELSYYFRLSKQFPGEATQEIRIAFYILQDLFRITKTYDQKELNKELQASLNEMSLLYGIPGMP
jgi:hypothetical protein